MLKAGTQNISGLYIGPEKIRKAYLGETLVFGANPAPEPGPSRLPEGYTEVEYIQSDGYCYIDTNQAASMLLDIKTQMDVEPLSATGFGYFFCSQKTSQATYYYSCFYTELSEIKARMGTSKSPNVYQKTITSNPDSKRISILYDIWNKTVSVDDVSVIFSDNSATSMPNIRLLGYNTSNYLSAKLHSCKMWKKGELIRDFVPCIDPSGAVGLYDLVESKVYANSGTGTLTAGPAV